MSDLLSNFGESAFGKSAAKVAAPLFLVASLNGCAMTPGEKPEAFRICEQEAAAKYEKGKGEKTPSLQEQAKTDGWAKTLGDRAKNAGSAAGAVGGAAFGLLSGIGAAGGASLGASVGRIGGDEERNKLFKECMDRRYAGSGTPKSGYEQRNSVPVDVKPAPTKGKAKRAGGVEESTPFAAL